MAEIKRLPREEAEEKYLTFKLNSLKKLSYEELLDLALKEAERDLRSLTDAGMHNRLANVSNGEFGCTRPDLDNKPPFASKREVAETNLAREQAITRARHFNRNSWPDQLDSGIMFFDGVRITKKEFEGKDS